MLITTYADDLKLSYVKRTLGEQDYTVLRDCSGNLTEADPNGVETTQQYGAMRRLVLTTTAPHNISITNVYDARRQLLGSTRIGTNGTAITTGQYAYDLAGRRTMETNALGGVTQYAESMGTYFTNTVSYPDGYQQEQYQRDGRIRYRLGPATQPSAWEYDLENVDSVWREYQKETKLTAAGQLTEEWVRTYYDGVGQVIKVVLSDATTGTLTDNPKIQYVYNNRGQLIQTLDPDNLSTVYQFNAKGELEWTYRGGIQTSRVLHDYVHVGGNDVRQQTQNYAYVNGNPILLSTKQAAVTGLQFWNTLQRDPYTPVTYLESIVHTNNGVRIETYSRPDNSKVKRTYAYDRLLSEVTLNNTGATNQMITYGYDAQGRLQTVIDSGTGTNILTYNNADQVTSLIVPPPADGQPAQTNSILHDVLGREIRVTDPDGNWRTNVYYPNGLLKLTYGARTYPVGYEYDGQGRKTRMTNWSNFASGTGERITQWKYNERGLVTNIVYPGGVPGPSFTYTNSGRLKTRTWARGVVIS